MKTTQWMTSWVIGLAVVLGAAAANAAITHQLGLAADNLTGLNDGDTVGTWSDSSSFGRNATTAAGAATYQTSVLNGKPVVRFDADAFTVDFTAGVTQPVTFFVVAEIRGNFPTNLPQSTDYLFDSDTGASRIIGGVSLGGSGGQLGMYAGTTVQSSNALDWQGGFKIYEFYFDGASSFVYLDGSLLFSGNPGSNGITAADDLQIGSRYNQAQYLNGDIAEFHVYSGTPTFSERQSIGLGLASKYDLEPGVYVPEPASLILLAAGGLLALRRRRRSMSVSQHARTGRPLGLATLLTFGLIGVLCTASAASFTTVANGNWALDATWSGTGYPVSGDEADIAHSVTVTGEQAFGDPLNQSDWTAGAIDISGASDKLTLATGSTFKNTSSAAETHLRGSGTFLNQGTFDHGGTGALYIGYSYGSGTTVFRNPGTLEISSSGIFYQHDNSTFRNENGGVIQRTASGTGKFEARGNAVAPVFEAQSGSILKAVASDSVLALTMPAVATASADGVSFEGAGTVQFSGYWSKIAGTISGSGRATTSTITVPAGGTTFNVTGSSEGLVGGGIYTLTGNATNEGIFTLQNGTQFQGTGEFINAAGGTLNLSSGTVYLGYPSSGPPIIRNQGTFVFGSGTPTLQTHNYGAVIINDSTGVMRRDVPGTGVIEKRGGVAGDGYFNNLGTVEVTAGEIEIRSTLLSTSVTGTTLTEGTWNVLAGADNATIDLQLATSGLTTIGSGATVVLSETGAGGTATFSQINGLNTVQGTFLVNGTKNFTSTAGGITVDGGTIGGTGTISETIAVTGGTVAPGASAGGTVIDGGLSLDSASTVEIEIGGTTFELDVSEQYDRIKTSGATSLSGALDITMLDAFVPSDGDLFGIIDAASLSGTFTGLGEGAEVWNNGEKMFLFITYQGLVTDTTVAMTGGTDAVLYAAEIPEPASLLLLAAGGLLALRRRRG